MTYGSQAAAASRWSRAIELPAAMGLFAVERAVASFVWFV